MYLDRRYTTALKLDLLFSIDISFLQVMFSNIVCLCIVGNVSYRQYVCFIIARITASIAILFCTSRNYIKANLHFSIEIVTSYLYSNDEFVSFHIIVLTSTGTA